MRACNPKDSSTVWGGIEAAHKAALENLDKLPIHLLHPQPLAISIKTSSFESLRWVLSLIHFPRWNAFLIYNEFSTRVSHDNFAKTCLFTSRHRSWRLISRSLLWSPIPTRFLWSAPPPAPHRNFVEKGWICRLSWFIHRYSEQDWTKISAIQGYNYTLYELLGLPRPSLAHLRAHGCRRVTNIQKGDKWKLVHISVI